MDNRFSLDFGAKPTLYIERLDEKDKVLKTFTSSNPATHLFILLGARGVGKTVLMTDISKILSSKKEWMHIDIPSYENTLESFAAYLYKYTSTFFKKIDLEINFQGVSISENHETKYSSIFLNLDQMLKAIKKKGKRLLITIDEAYNSKEMREFTTYYQHCIREELPLFVIMTGLYKNIKSLQNNKSLTFLKRAPKVTLGMLNISRIAWQYKMVFGISEEAAFEMAKYTNGYSYAFQILGYLLCERSSTIMDDDLLFEYRVMLEEHSYEKIWEELSQKEKDVAMACAKNNKLSIQEIRKFLNMDSNNFSTHKITLEKCGVLSEKASHGYVEFDLPFIKEYILKQE